MGPLPVNYLRAITIVDQPAVVPEIKLPDYKQIAVEANKDKESAEVTDEDLETAIKG